MRKALRSLLLIVFCGVAAAEHIHDEPVRIYRLGPVARATVSTGPPRDDWDTDHYAWVQVESRRLTHRFVIGCG